MFEVTSYKSFLDEQKQQINDQVEQPEGFELFRWWADHHKRFPNLTFVVKKLLCIPATSANCERIHFTLTDVVIKKRNRLKSETTHKLTLLKHNLTLILEYTKNRNKTTYQEDQEDEDQNMSDVDHL